MELKEAQNKILEAIKNNFMCIAIGECYVEYVGRASSKLPRGKRMLLIKGDSSFSIHENRLIRPTNYMVGARIACEIDDEKNALKISSKKQKPAEKIDAFFYSIDDVVSYDVPQSNDLRLTGSEKELNDALMEDLSFLITASKKGIIWSTHSLTTTICS